MVIGQRITDNIRHPLTLTRHPTSVPEHPTDDTRRTTPIVPKSPLMRPEARYTTVNVRPYPTYRQAPECNLSTF